MVTELFAREVSSAMYASTFGGITWLIRMNGVIAGWDHLQRPDALDHVIILDERRLRRVLSSYFQYHHDARTHLSLNKDCPRPRRVQLPSAGNIIAFPEVGGLHHRYERRAA